MGGVQQEFKFPALAPFTLMQVVAPALSLFLPPITPWH
jgi:hypothetical protein